MKIVYRVVNGILAAAVFPAFFFLQLFDMKVSTSVFDYGLELEYSVKKLIDLLNGKSEWGTLVSADKLKTLSFPENLNGVKGRCIAFLVFLALALLCALAVLIMSFITNKRIPYLVGSCLGIVSVITFMVLFASVAKVFTAGDINLVKLFTDSWLVGLLGNFVTVDFFAIGGFANAMLFLFIGLAVWTGIFYLTELGEEPAKTVSANAPNATKKKRK